MVIPDVLRWTLKDEEFLLYDSDNGSKRILMYSTYDNLKILEKCNIWFADGTFKCVPVIFTQLYAIHGYVESKNSSFVCVPLVYFLLPDTKNVHV